MYTNLDKAIVALIVGIVGFVSVVFGKSFGITPETVSGIVAVATPFLVYIWPNAPKDPA